MLALSHNTSELISRIQGQVQNLAPDAPQLKEALERIGLYITALAKMNVRQRGLIDTGRLLNSIRYEYFREGTISGIAVGSFNVPYAAAHEFGYQGIVKVRGYTASRGGASYSVRDHSRKMNVRRRSFLRPAVKMASPFIIDTLRAALLFANGGR
jgi:phage gpG-like protein